jgi:Cft2 family RNA processing exonuclease
MGKVIFRIEFKLFIALLLFACNNDRNKQNNEKDSTSSSSKTNDASNAEVKVNPLKDCYFGDLHLHTSLSPDANMIGTIALPEDSYKYAMGEEVTYMGQKIKRNAPLDFLAVTDHAEYLGVIAAIKDPNGPFAGTDRQKLYSSKEQKDIANRMLTLWLA